MAQIQPQTFKHVIIMVQENRTPDNLFGASPTLGTCGQEKNPIITGADIDNGGYGLPYAQPQAKPQLICTIPLSITGQYNGQKVDPDHSHQEPTLNKQNQNYGKPGGWFADYDGGAMDGFCHEYDMPSSNGVCPSYSYVPQSEAQPYFDIAAMYGFANYTFQTNQGPSLPAHQFLFAGTSAPVPVNDPSGEWTWFDAELINYNSDGGSQDSTCTAQWPPVEATLIDASGNEPSYDYCNKHQSDPHCAPPCYERGIADSNGKYTWGSLADLLGAQNPPITWKYYAPPLSTPNGSKNYGLWAAPASINHFCQASGGQCAGLLNNGQYASNMRWELSSPAAAYPLWQDITSCQLAQVSWAIPDALWSDHANETNGSGPAYVANIVNAVGNQTCGTEQYWKDTAIFVVWDDWGGWYDHINPDSPGGPGVWQGGAPWGNWYTYGFRVPLLVVSAYTGTGNPQTGYSGYVSGACGTGTNNTCPNFGVNGDKRYVHDFGSILAFIEWNFLGPAGIGTIGQGYRFADYYAPEWQEGPAKFHCWTSSR